MNFRPLVVSPNDDRQLAINADRSFFLNRNILERSNMTRLPKWSSAGIFSDADLSRPSHPAYCAIDGLTSRATVIDPTLDTNFSGMTTTGTLYLLFAPSGTYGGVLNHADAFMVWIANLAELVANGVTFSLELANGNTFGSPTPIAWWNALAIPQLFGVIATPNFDRNARAYAWTLGGNPNNANYEYFGIAWARLRFDGPVGVFAFHQPQILECMLGPKNCLSRSPSFGPPEGLNEFEPLIGDFMSSGGTRADLVFAESRTAPTADWDPFQLGAFLEQGSGATIDNGAELLDQFKKAKHGTRNFVFVLNPATHPERAPFFHLEKPGFAIHRPEGKQIVGSLKNPRWLEQGPFVDDEQPDEAFVNGHAFGPFAATHAVEVATNNGLTAHNAMTWSIWLRMIDVPLNTSGVLFQISNGTITPFSVNLLGSGGQWTTAELIIADGITAGATYTATLTHPLTVISGWHHLAFAYLRSPDGIVHAVCEIDVDGVQQTTSLAAGSAVTGAIQSASYPLTIGAACPALSFGSGIGPAYIDEPAIFDRFYDHGMRVLWLWNGGTPRPLGLAPFLNSWSWWRAELNSFDYGILGNDGTLQNGLGYVGDHP